MGVGMAAGGFTIATRTCNWQRLRAQSRSIRKIDTKIAAWAGRRLERCKDRMGGGELRDDLEGEDENDDEDESGRGRS